MVFPKYRANVVILGAAKDLLSNALASETRFFVAALLRMTISVNLGTQHQEGISYGR